MQAKGGQKVEIVVFVGLAELCRVMPEAAAVTVTREEVLGVDSDCGSGSASTKSLPI